MTTTNTGRRGAAWAAAAEFWHPSPWLLAVALVSATTARAVVADWGIGDALLPFAMLAAFPFLEWMIHVSSSIGGRGGSLVSRLIQSWRASIASTTSNRAMWIWCSFRSGPWSLSWWRWSGSLWAFPGPAWRSRSWWFCSPSAWSEWTHYLIHGDYKPKNGLYRAIWRDHRLHHYKNEITGSVSPIRNVGSRARHLPGRRLRAYVTDREEPARTPSGVDDDRVSDADLTEVPGRVIGAQVNAAVAHVRVALRTDGPRCGVHVDAAQVIRTASATVGFSLRGCSAGCR